MKFQIPRIAPSDITPQDAFHNRRAILASLLAAGATSALRTSPAAADPQATAATRLQYTRNAKYSVTEPPNKYEEITSYNNFYEFGTDKEDPKANSGSFKPEPWSVAIDGEAEVKGKFTLEDILKGQALEERIYRFRCVEAWSMVIPWVGFPLSALLARFKPTSKAKYVELTTLYDPRRMPGQRAPILRWPYVEGLRMDEAMHPLTLMVVGLYGQTLPNQDGAPLRLIVPWKYGFKSIKSIVRFTFTDQRPKGMWEALQPSEYGFWANVNPEMPHPRWSQASEEIIGTGERRPTLLFNGYGDYVAGLYKGLENERLWA